VTELISPTVTVLSSGNLVPEPVLIGFGGRVPPGEIIENDATGDVETSGVFDPAQDGLDFWESLEGMRVVIQTPVAVGPATQFGEIPVVADDGTAGLRTPRGGIIIQPNDFNPERIFLDDLAADTPDSVNVGDHFSGPAIGVVDWSFGNWKLEIESPLTRVAGPITPEVTATPTIGQLAVGTFNVANLSTNDPPGKFWGLADLIVNNMKAPDILAVEEVQDNNGATDNGVVDATTTYNTLISAISAAGGPTYDFRQINPVNDQDGGQ